MEIIMNTVHIDEFFYYISEMLIQFLCFRDFIEYFKKYPKVFIARDFYH